MICTCVVCFQKFEPKYKKVGTFCTVQCYRKFKDKNKPKPKLRNKTKEKKKLRLLALHRKCHTCNIDFCSLTRTDTNFCTNYCYMQFYNKTEKVFCKIGYCKKCNKCFHNKSGFQKFCSKLCRPIKVKKNHKNDYKKKCIICGVIFYKKGPYKYCSKKCKPKQISIYKPRIQKKQKCINCNSIFYAKANQIYCKKKCRPSSKTHKYNKWVNKFGQKISRKYKKDIIHIFKNRPEGYQVDHIVPLNHELICGLHVPWNMQYLTVLENRWKSNHFEEELCNGKIYQSLKDYTKSTKRAK